MLNANKSPSTRLIFEASSDDSKYSDSYEVS